jgi:hypothetical protein
LGAFRGGDLLAGLHVVHAEALWAEGDLHILFAEEFPHLVEGEEPQTDENLAEAQFQSLSRGTVLYLNGLGQILSTHPSLFFGILAYELIMLESHVPLPCRPTFRLTGFCF